MDVSQQREGAASTLHMGLVWFCGLAAVRFVESVLLFQTFQSVLKFPPNLWTKGQLSISSDGWRALPGVVSLSKWWKVFWWRPSRAEMVQIRLAALSQHSCFEPAAKLLSPFCCAHILAEYDWHLICLNCVAFRVRTLVLWFFCKNVSVYHRFTLSW